MPGTHGTVSALRPVFIIGAHRSGTSILYRVLAETGCFNTVTLFDVVNRHRLADFRSPESLATAQQELAAYLVHHNVQDRGYDALPVRPELPVEYQLAFEHQGRRPMLNDSNIDAFLDFCTKVQAWKPAGRPLLLKNPFDPRNFVYLHERLPEARFIFIHRHPAEVINSMMNAVSSLLESRNEFEAMLVPRYRSLFENPVKLALGRLLYSRRLPFLYQHVSRFHAASCDYVAQNRLRVGDAGIDIRYRDLCRDPEGAVSKILGFLGLHPALPAGCTSLMNPREPRLVPAVERHRDSIARRNKRFCEMFGV